MPGPQSTPWAKTSKGQLVAGKTSLRAHKLSSRENMTRNDWNQTHNYTKKGPAHNREKTIEDTYEERDKN